MKEPVQEEQQPQARITLSAPMALVVFLFLGQGAYVIFQMGALNQKVEGVAAIAVDIKAGQRETQSKVTDLEVRVRSIEYATDRRSR